MSVRTGIGFDAHAFGEGRPLMLGCIHVDHDRGLAGHSDGDVLAHAICDAVLGAAGLGDLGDRFPEEPQWAGAGGSALLAATARLVAPASITWIDAVLVCEAPRIASLRGKMSAAIADALGIDAVAVSVKGTTTDRMGFAGRGEGIAAMAVVTLDLPDGS